MAELIHWLIEHGPVFADMAWVWLVPILLVVATARLLRQPFGVNQAYVVLDQVKSIENLESEQERPTRVA